MRRSLALAAAAGLAAGALVLVPARAKAPEPAPSTTVGDLEAGRSTYVGGVYAWTDYAYDDRGPDTNGRAGGDATYPADMSPNNVADLIQVQLRRAAGNQIGVRVVLETLTPETTPLVGIAIDSDGDPATGPAALPGSWTSSGALGVDRLGVLGNGTGEVLEAKDGAWSRTGA